MGRARVYLPRNCHHYFYEWEGAVIEYIGLWIIGGLIALSIAVPAGWLLWFFYLVFFSDLRGDYEYYDDEI